MVSERRKIEWKKKGGKQYQRTHMIAGLVHHYPIAPMGFNGSCNTDVFEAWGEE
jgi:hypothetical protein